ncbi:methyltransferase domain-containing protein [Polaromonas sp.]|uniref:SAM-dependent methyltransferase n=1 Tax=Polaromonas sp. TaxID=1869339 RepID=UPI003263AD3D
MSTTTPVAHRIDTPTNQGKEARLADIRSYYNAVADDYRAWSPGMNMHFGYWSWKVNPLGREAMLERMNLEVLRRLALPRSGAVLLADLGCGAGATARSIVKNRKHSTVDAVTLVARQIVQGAQLNQAAALHNQVRFHLADYVDTDLRTGAYDGVYALESACHAPGADKRALVREATRLLRPGGTLVITDAFRRNSKPLPGFMERIYRLWCRNWAVNELAEKHALHAALASHGFTDIRFQDISLRLAPSALQIPLFATRFALRELWRARFRLSPLRRGHIVASYAAFLLGMWLPGFGYYMVTARKPADSDTLPRHKIN